jgi:hypothetical protein
MPCNTHSKPLPANTRSSRYWYHRTLQRTRSTLAQQNENKQTINSQPTRWINNAINSHSPSAPTKPTRQRNQNRSVPSTRNNKPTDSALDNYATQDVQQLSQQQKQQLNPKRRNTNTPRKMCHNRCQTLAHRTPQHKPVCRLIR